VICLALLPFHLSVIGCYSSLWQGNNISHNWCQANLASSPE